MFVLFPFYIIGTFTNSLLMVIFGVANELPIGSWSRRIGTEFNLSITGDKNLYVHLKFDWKLRVIPDFKAFSSLASRLGEFLTV